jgi:transcriptional regulator with XRE-family HTH domain
VDADFARRVGERLRAIRVQKGLSLHDVEKSSHKEFKASVLGAYELGERSISVRRLQRLGQYYGVPTDQLLPDPDRVISLDGPGPRHGVRIDLARLTEVEGPEAPVIGRYLTMIQRARGDFNGKVMTVRDDDVRALAAVLDTTPDSLASRIETLGLRALR